jgi:transposase
LAHVLVRVDRRDDDPRLGYPEEELVAESVAHEAAQAPRQRARAPATNWRGEQAIRPAVVNRKSWGGNRTAHGADVQQTLMSVIRTGRQQHVSPIALLEDLLRQRIPAPNSMLRLPASAADPRGP